eukprot:1015246-Pleurochrysis_carterae.AAC.2
MAGGGLTMEGTGGAADVVVGGDVGVVFSDVGEVLCDVSPSTGTSDRKCVAITRANRKFRSGG